MIRLFVVCVLLWSLSGCSMLWVRRPPSPPPVKQWVMCTENRVWPIVDAAAAVAMLSPLVYFAVAERDARSRTLGLAFGIPLFGAAAVGLGFSSMYGFHQTQQCVDLHDAYEKGPFDVEEAR